MRATTYLVPNTFTRTGQKASDDSHHHVPRLETDKTSEIRALPHTWLKQTIERAKCMRLLPRACASCCMPTSQALSYHGDAR